MLREYGSSPNADANAKPPAFLSFRSSEVFIISTVSFSVFVDIFLYAVVVPVVPFALHERANVPQHQTQYYVSVLLAAYGAALLVASPICGWVSDKLSSRLLPFISGLFLLAGATLCLCLGNRVSVLIVGRVFQGASAAIPWTTGLSLCVDTVGTNKIGRAMGFVGSAMSVGLLTGPILGGVVFRLSGYYTVFAMCFGLLGIDAIMRLAVIEKKTRRYWLGEAASCSNSIPGTSVLTTPTACISGTATPSSRVINDSSVNANNISGTLPTHHAQAPKIPQRPFLFRLPPIFTLLTSRRLLAALWGTLVQAILLTAFDSTLPLEVKKVFGWDSLGAGLLFIPLVIPTFLSPLFGFLSDKYGPRWITAGGFLLSCPFVICLGLIKEDHLNQKIMLCGFLFSIGLSFSLAFAPLMAEISYAVESKTRPTAKRGALKLGKNGAYGQAYALFCVAFAGGCMIGPIWGGMIRAAAGWSTATWTLGLLNAISTIPAMLWSGGWFFDKSKRVWPPPDTTGISTSGRTIGEIQVIAPKQEV